jgi:type II secretory pathway pseudopilin PulG
MVDDAAMNSPAFHSEKGFVYLWALFSVVLAGVVMAGAGQVWQLKSQRDKEAELMHIGEQFRLAIMSYYNSGTKQYPESLEDLLKDERSPNIKRHLRKIYLDPITNTAEWGLIDEPPPNTAAANTTGSTANKSATSNTTNPTANKSTTPNSSLAPSDNSQTSATNPAQALSGNNPAQTSPGNNPATGSAATPNTSSGMGSNIGKRITGVYSLSDKKPIKKKQFPEQYNKFSEAVTYQDWKFVYKPGDSKTPAGAGGASAKPNTPSGTNPFAPQSSSSSSNKSASPFSSPSSSSGDSTAPAAGGFSSPK